MTNVDDAETEAPGAERLFAPGLSLLGSLAIVARRHGIELSAPQLIKDHMLAPAQLSVAQIISIANNYGLTATQAQLNWQELLRLEKSLPAIVLLRNGYAMILKEIHQGPNIPFPRIVLQDPNGHEEAPLILDETRFCSAWTGDVLLFIRKYKLGDERQPFGFRLVAGLVLHERRFLYAIALSALTLSALALVPILFWRLLVDRVLYSGSLDTLAALCSIVAILFGFETAFAYLRRFFVLRLTQRFDAKLSPYVFGKLISLPIDYFERTPKGETVRAVWEINKIRTALGQGVFGVLLDNFVLFIFLPIMFFFSPFLTCLIMTFAVATCGWIMYCLPELRRRTAASVGAETEKNTFLIETLHGIRTVKALALDARRRHEWDTKAAKAARLRFDAGCMENITQTFVTPLERLMVIGVLILAVYLTIASHEEIYPGALFAFFMLAQRIATPLVRLAEMITQYDEGWIAIGVIAGVINRASEVSRPDAVRTPLIGRVEFSHVRFRYPGTVAPALDDVSFTIPAGSVLGVMGRSGSGKTTVTRLLQLFHSNYQGSIKIDGVELRQYDLTHLRSSFGVVSQENFLFSGTIRETITAAKPDASFDEVVMAARLAGAEEFIERLPRGYDTYLNEGSSNLSGGQRQRLAIARALITNPRILILDEATSALDAESEAIVNANLARIAEGRTMIVVSHRLSSLVNADAILVLERGKIYDIGTHAELVDRCDIYSNLWHQQHQHLTPKPSHEVISLQPAGHA